MRIHPLTHESAAVLMRVREYDSAPLFVFWSPHYASFGAVWSRALLCVSSARVEVHEGEEEEKRRAFVTSEPKPPITC